MIPTEQKDSESRQRVIEFESWWLNRLRWGTPILFLIGYYAIGQNLRWLLFLQYDAEASAKGISHVGLAIGTGFALAPWLFWIANRVRFRLPELISKLSAMFIVLTLIVAMSTALDHPKARFTLEECVKARAPQLDYVRNIAFNQQNLRSKSETLDPGGIRVARIGSSQINLGIEPKLLSQLTGAEEVVSVCMPGMVPVQYLALADQLILKQPTHVVCWLSEFDFYRESSLPTTRLRWCSNPANFASILATLSLQQRFNNRGELADLVAASLCTIWQQRSLIEKVASRSWWKWDLEAGQADKDELLVGGQLVGLDQGIKNAQKNVRRTPMVDSNFRAFESFAAKLHKSGIQLVVFEGECHPQAMASYRVEFRRETRDRLTRCAESHHFQYVTASTRTPFATNDWRDAVHLNDDGRRKLTHLVAAYLTAMTPETE